MKDKRKDKREDAPMRQDSTIRLVLATACAFGLTAGPALADNAGGTGTQPRPAMNSGSSTNGANGGTHQSGQMPDKTTAAEGLHGRPSAALPNAKAGAPGSGAGSAAKVGGSTQ